MSIDSLPAQSPNTIHRSVRPQMENADPARQNQQAASDIDIAQETNSTPREAFQVQISLQAQGRLAADTSDSTQDVNTQSAEPYEAQPQPGPGANQGRGSGLIVDITS